jgi:hypothetical protein
MKSTDPYGQTPNGRDGEVYGPKQQVLDFIREQKKGLSRLERSMRAQTEILNDASRAAVYRELISDLRSQAGDARYHEAYKVEGMAEMADKLEGWIRYLTKYGWAEKYEVDGEPKLPTLEQKVDEAYIRHGAAAVVELFAR